NEEALPRDASAPALIGSTLSRVNSTGLRRRQRQSRLRGPAALRIMGMRSAGGRMSESKRKPRKIETRTQLRQPSQPVAEIIASGLPKAKTPLRVVVVGAGMAGL